MVSCYYIREINIVFILISRVLLLKNPSIIRNYLLDNSTQANFCMCTKSEHLQHFILQAIYAKSAYLNLLFNTAIINVLKEIRCIFLIAVIVLCIENTYSCCTLNINHLRCQKNAQLFFKGILPISMIIKKYFFRY